MSKLKKIPVLGYLIRLIVAIVKLPKHVEQLYRLQAKEAELVEHMSRRETELAEHLSRQETELVEHLSRQETELAERMSRRETELAERMSRQEERTNICNNDIEELRHWNSDRMREIQMIQNLNLNREQLRKLRTMLSNNYALWGAEERLHISPLAAVNSCFFNTNSGHITIGDYTFAGSGVSILAGSHDMRLTGVPRRDVELKEGCDIRIGRGVWLASNCTILGSVIIEDNAVIAAGAVVTPGTRVPTGTVYGGVPAKKIKDISLTDDGDWNAECVCEALERCSGILYLDGWTEVQEISIDGQTYRGHWIQKSQAQILTTKQIVCLNYIKDEQVDTLYYKIDDLEEQTEVLQTRQGSMEIRISEQKDIPHVLTIRMESKDGRIFMLQER